MKSYKLSQRARLDYFAAFDYIAQHSQQAALRWEERMLEAFDHLADWPETGRVRPEYAPKPLRFWVVGDFVIVYEPSTDPREIIAILHGARNITSLLAERLIE